MMELQSGLSVFRAAVSLCNVHVEGGYRFFGGESVFRSRFIIGVEKYDFWRYQFVVNILPILFTFFCIHALHTYNMSILRHITEMVIYKQTNKSYDVRNDKR
jgi:hypothetical protein